MTELTWLIYWWIILCKNGKKNYVKAEVLGRLSSNEFVKEIDWIWMFSEDERYNIKHHLKLDILQEDKEKPAGSQSKYIPWCWWYSLKNIQRNRATANYFLMNHLSNENNHQQKIKLPIIQVCKNKGDKHSASNYRPVSLTSIVWNWWKSFSERLRYNFWNLIIFGLINSLASSREL